MKKVLNRIGLGKLVYLFVALKQLLFLNPSPMTLVIDDDNVQQFSKVYFTAVMNQKYEGGGFKFCPHASPSDGYLDVIVVDGLSKPKVLCCLPTAFFGKHTLFRGVHIFRCKKIDIHSDLALPGAQRRRIRRNPERFFRIHRLQAGAHDLIISCNAK